MIGREIWFRKRILIEKYSRGMLFVVLVCGLLGVYFQQELRGVFREIYGSYSARQQRSALKILVERDLPRLQHLTTDWERVAALRDFVYHHTTTGYGTWPIPLTGESYTAWRSGANPQVCSGMAVIYLSLLEAFGYESRLVNLAAEPLTKNTLNTHSTVEVLLNGSWVLMDPTFNSHWQVGGKAVGVEKLRDAYKQGQAVTPDSDGYSLLPHRSLNDYYIPYSALLEHVEISRFFPFGNDSVRQIVISTLPGEISWRYKAGYQPLTCPERQKGTLIYERQFGLGLASDWQMAPAASVVHNNGTITVNTDASNEGYQLWSEPIDIPGRKGYRLVVDGRVLSGGAMIGVLNAEKNTWVASNSFHSTQWHLVRGGNGNCVMTLDFEIPEGLTKSYKIILSNWSFEGQPSQWLIKGVQVQQLDTIKANPTVGDLSLRSMFLEGLGA